MNISAKRRINNKNVRQHLEKTTSSPSFAVKSISTVKKKTHTKKKNTKKTRNARRGTLGARRVCFTPRILPSAKPEFFSMIFFSTRATVLPKSGNGVMLKRLKTSITIQ